MWKVALICLMLQIFVFGQNLTNFTKVENKIIVNNSKINTSDTREVNKLKITEFGSFLDDMVDWASSATEYIKGKSVLETIFEPTEDGRKLKYKKAENKFVMKTLVILKVILVLFLPIGIIASKILSWKAVTLSLMAFMLAKILFVKNLLTGKNTFSITPTNFVPPFFIHGGPNDAFWKRQGDVQNVYPWAST